MKNWKSVYKKAERVNGQTMFGIFFDTRKNLNLFGKIRMSIAEWLLTPYLLTKEDYKGKNNETDS